MIPFTRKGYLRTGKYGENRGNYDYSKINVITVPKCIAIHECYENFYPAVIMSSPIFPTFSSTLVPFSHERNQYYYSLGHFFSEALHS